MLGLARIRQIISCIVMAGTLCAAGAVAFATEVNPYLGMSIEALMEVKLSVASKKPQSLSDTPAAVFVLTQEEIKRSGATSLPEALRQVPGVEVERVDGHTWAVSARGFTSGFSSGLLVMVDGRSVFTPLFSGVYWDVQNVMLEDVDRIEVVRGPGGAVWGANAVNGVINIITKSAHDTTGGLLVAGAGDGEVERGFSALRYGFKLGESGSARIFAKGFSRKDDNVRANGPVSDWQEQRGGLRADWDLGDNRLMLDAAVYRGHETTVSTLMFPAAPFSQLTAYRSETNGGHVLGLWERNGLSLQAYFDRTERRRLTFSEQRNTTDLEIKYHANPLPAHDLQIGMGYRITADQTVGSLALSLNPASRTDQLYSAFIQDEIELAPSLLLTLGAKVEHNDYTGYEWAPTARLMWKASESQRFWLSASRAYEPPSRADSDLSQLFVNSPFFKLGLVPNSNLRSAELTAYELGYRIQPEENVSLDATAYFNDHHYVVSFETLPFDPVNSISGIQAANFLAARSYGIEFALAWQPFDVWRLRASYAWSRTDARSTGGNDNVTLTEIEGNVPRQIWTLNSALDLPADLTLDNQLYVVSASAARQIPAYTRVDLRLGWKPVDPLELSVAVQNLLDDQHSEFPDSAGGRASFGRSLYGKMAWSF